MTCFEIFELEVVVDFNLLRFCKILVQVNHTSNSTQDRCSCTCNWRIGFLRKNLVIFEITQARPTCPEKDGALWT